jgi:hypothetical protein
MWLGRVIIKNFRNFKSLDVKLGEHAVVLGENELGKPLLFTLRQEWPWIPIPSDVAVLKTSAHLGKEITTLLDIHRSVKGVSEAPFLVWLFFFTKTSLRTCAFSFAETLLRTCATL